MGAGPGRPKGLQNKATREFKETVQMLLRENSDNVARWLKSVAEGDAMNDIKPDPYKALDLLGKLAEYATPKLARTELSGELNHKVDLVSTLKALKGNVAS